jgi:hypothetical protein
MEVYLLRALERGTQRRERLGGPRHSVERGHSSRIRGHDAGRTCQPVPHTERQQAHQASGTYGEDHPGHNQDHADQLGDGASTGPASLTASAAPTTTNTAIPKPLPPQAPGHDAHGLSPTAGQCRC